MNKVRILPKSQHFDNIEPLRKDIKDYEKTRLFNFEKFNKSYFPVPKNKFEKIRISKNRFILIPTALTYSTLFRGQTKKYEKCLPTLQRNNLSEDEIFIENLKNTEFELLLDNHPVIDGIFKPNGFEVDYLGLAQHYGLKTNMLDLTLDFDIAMFFATCNYDEKTDSFYPQSEPINTGVLYAYSTIYELHKDSFFLKDLKVIGLQPFKRPAVQKGFSLELNSDKYFNGIEYTFSYTKNDAIYYYELFNKGESLWIKDDLAVRAKLIKNSKQYSLHGLTLAVKRYAPKGKGIAYYQNILHKKGFSYREKKNLEWTFTEKDKIRIAKNWDKNENDPFWNSIVCREMIANNIKYEERDINALKNELELRHIQGGKVIA